MSLDATVGGANSNSYVTVAEAGIYFGDRSFSSAWEDFDDQPQALILASSMLDWYMKFKGTKATTTQSMQWPRQDVIRPDSTEVATDIIPPEVKVAVYELTLSSLSADRTTDSSLAGLDQIQAGSLLIKAETNGYPSTMPKTIPSKINNILSDLVTAGRGKVVRLIRA